MTSTHYTELRWRLIPDHLTGWLTDGELGEAWAVARPSCAEFMGRAKPRHNWEPIIQRYVDGELAGVQSYCARCGRLRLTAIAEDGRRRYRYARLVRALEGGAS